MKPARSNKNLMKKAFKSRSGSLNQDPVEVFCRIKPIPASTTSCLKAISPTTVLLSPPETTVAYRNGNNLKELHCTFTQVFDENVMQDQVFEKVALNLVSQLVAGKNGLLFTYGVTGSGKTYTMTGEPQNPGIMPRCLEVLFNAIGNFQASKYVFKPDHMNGFEIQDEDDAAAAFRNEPVAFAVPKTPKTPRRREADGDFFFVRNAYPENVVSIDKDNMYSCFVTYIEIYNNSVFDLLDPTEEAITRRLQNKVIREDGNRNMYVHGVTEIEVKSPEDAFEVFSRGQKRKKVAYTLLNDESSRSHSVFTIRLVQAPYEDTGDDAALQRKLMTISQLSLVDLAGSERTNKTKSTGQRLREAGSINTSLMTLRTCIETLRENQQTKGSKMVPYRDSRLTHLFKHYFDGEGAVRMVVCVNPRAEDYDETVHVLRFAEITQEVQVTRPTPLRLDVGLKPSRRRGQVFKSHEDLAATPVKLPTTYFPGFPKIVAEDDDSFRILEQFLENRLPIRATLLAEHLEAEENFRRELLNQQSEYFTEKQENIGLRGLLEFERKKSAAGTDSMMSWERERADMLKKIREHEQKNQNLAAQLESKDLTIKQLNLEKEMVKEKCIDRIGKKKEQYKREMENKIQRTKDNLEEVMLQKDEKIRQVKELLATPRITPRVPRRGQHEVNTQGTLYQPPLSSGVTPRGPAVCNIRHRRSRSAGGDVDRWLDHRPAQPVELNTVFQPTMRKKRSITKLVDVKDVVNPKTSKYCLTTQEQDTDGELETKLYKGDVIPTCSGGAQIILNDVETLKQTSPTNVHLRKRSVQGENTDDRCRVAIEGHGKRPRSEN